MEQMKQEIKSHLTEVIIPFWYKMMDDVNGGFYGQMDGNLTINKVADKGVIMHSRILWFFANAYMELKDEKLKMMAEHCCDFLLDRCMDKENGGLYWSVDYKGNFVDTTKHAYCQAFGIYALSSYYDISKSARALQAAMDLFEVVETKCMDEFGYLEAFNEDFTPASNEKLSENGIMADKTMNTLLHLFEAYTELYRVAGREMVANRMRYMMDIFSDRVYNPKRQKLEVFFDREMNSIIDLHSYGHDIEAAWLIDLGCDVLGESAYTKKMSVITKNLTETIYKTAFTGNYLLNENENGVDDVKAVWWVQAEAVVGFLNGYKKTQDKAEYLSAAKEIWTFIKDRLLDSRAGSEWLNEVDSDGTNDRSLDIAGPWKAPYHNGRMCLEVLKRL